MKESREVLKEHDKEGHSVNNTGFLMYRSYYNITMLQIIDNGTTYHCQAMINANPSVNDSSSFTLNVLGECIKYASNVYMHTVCIFYCSFT